jgi:putative ABC transport system permease protein
MFRIVTSGLRADLRRVVAAAIAVVLGVAFLAATLVLGDTMRSGFRDAFVAGNEGLSVVVRSETRLGNDDMAVDIGTVPASLIETIAAVDGIGSVAIHVEGRAQILDPSGRPLGGDGPPTLAANWIDDSRLSPWSITEGRPPVAQGEVVIDRASARRAGLSVGDTTTLRTPDPLVVTIVGVATFAGEDSQGPVTQTLFDTTTAQDLFLRDRAAATSIRIAALDGVSEAEAADRVAAVLPPGTEAVTGTDLSAEQLADLERDFIGFFQGMLMVFAGIGLVVATLTIHNTFAIIVAQRGRQSALLRAIGASRRQVLVAVGAESAVVGIVAAAAGVSAGIGLAALAVWGMDAAGFGVPGSLQWTLTSLVVAWSVGVVATLAASILPAVHASRVAPLAAVRELSADRTATSRVRIALGASLAVMSAALSLVGLGGADVSLRLTGLGALAALGAVVVAGPALARPLASAIGWPVAMVRGRTGMLARRNAVRNPRRTASTAASLMVGVAVVVFFSTTAYSLTAYIDRTVDAQFAGDLVIQNEDWSGPGLSGALAPRLDALAETAVVVPMGNGVVRAGDQVIYPTLTEPAALDALIDVDITSGGLDDLAESDVAVSTRLADEQGWQVGDIARLEVSGTTVEFGVGAVFASRDLVGDLIMHAAAWDRHGPLAPMRVVAIGLAPGTDAAAARQAVATIAAEESAPAPLDRAAYVDQVSAEINQMIAVIFALLAVAVLIAVMGIGNTMSLSVHERTRELGLLRALGMGRSSVRAAVRWESAIVAAFGSLLGLALGTGGAWMAVRAFADAEAIDITLVVPGVTFLVILLLGASAGVVAGVRPARRAARIDVLDALATT